MEGRLPAISCRSSTQTHGGPDEPARSLTAARLVNVSLKDRAPTWCLPAWRGWCFPSPGVTSAILHVVGEIVAVATGGLALHLSSRRK
ncbi:hypothetical protein AK812_SmicGene26792 [Symbiodinium microadriaticum]|uniref:Uncharacterized protein n=1 Tax=Symbiodinium microadriaticum TaxID=2951 RepID=A0A1Q9D8P0_SYMMI|nr:hypothetical protein AK812_SmicGene26792 [Symbiodinium microadriaticum]